jgi:fructose-bisphosphate aldolase class II
MSLIPMVEILRSARAAGYAVGAFNFITLECGEAIVTAAEQARAPVILQVSQNAVTYHGSLEPVAAAGLALAQGSRVPVAIHLDHATSRELCELAVAAGFASVMLDASNRPWEDNVRLTTETAAWVHERGVALEAELGVVGGKDGIHAPGVRTDPADARRFVEQTGVDALAVAVGTSHAMLDRSARIDFELIARLRATVPVPLVLHGSSGVRDEDLAEAVRRGITKVNIATQMNQAFTTAVRAHLERDAAVVDPRRYLASGRDAMAAAVAAKLRLFGSAGRA